MRMEPLAPLNRVASNPRPSRMNALNHLVCTPAFAGILLERKSEREPHLALATRRADDRITVVVRYPATGERGVRYSRARVPEGRRVSEAVGFSAELRLQAFADPEFAKQAGVDGEIPWTAQDVSAGVAEAHCGHWGKGIRVK